MHALSPTSSTLLGVSLLAFFLMTGCENTSGSAAEATGSAVNATGFAADATGFAAKATGSAAEATGSAAEATGSAAEDAAIDGTSTPATSLTTDVMPLIALTCGGCQRRTDAPFPAAVVNGAYCDPQDDLRAWVGSFIIPGDSSNSGFVAILTQQMALTKTHTDTTAGNGGTHGKRRYCNHCVVARPRRPGKRDPALEESYVKV